MDPYKPPSAEFIRICQLELRAFLARGGHKVIKAMGIRFLIAIWSNATFTNLFFRKDQFIKITNRSKFKATLDLLESQGLIERAGKMILLNPKMAKKYKTKKKEYNWFRLHDAAFDIATDKDLNLSDLSVLITVYAYMEYKNEYKLNISETAKMAGICQPNCSHSFKKLVGKGYLVKGRSDELRRNIYIANNNVVTRGNLKS